MNESAPSREPDTSRYFDRIITCDYCVASDSCFPAGFLVLSMPRKRHTSYMYLYQLVCKDPLFISSSSCILHYSNRSIAGRRGFCLSCVVWRAWTVKPVGVWRVVIQPEPYVCAGCYLRNTTNCFIEQLTFLSRVAGNE